MNKAIDALLVAAVIIPVALLLWPFAMWNDSMLLLLRIIPAIAAQVFLFRVGKRNIVKTLPVLVAGAIAAWGTYLWCTSPHWNSAAFWGDLIADYVSPFIACLLALIACILAKKSCSVWLKWGCAAAGLCLAAALLILMSRPTKPQIPEPDSWAQPVHFYLHGKGYFHRGEIAYELPEGYEFAGNVLDVGEVDADSRKDFEGNADGKIYMNPSVSDIAYFSWAEWNEKADGPAPFLKLKRESTEPIIFVQDFSYAKDSEVYTEGKPGVKTSGFLNTSEMEINADNVVERAKNECTIHWREVSVRRDTAAGIWLVVFGNHYPGGGQSVYLDDHGKTVLIVYGE